MKIVAQQKFSIAVVTVGAGILSLTAGILGPFLIHDAVWFLAAWSVWLVVCGTFVMTIGVTSWRPGGVAIAFDDHGIHWHSPAIKNAHRFIPWTDVLGARLIRISDGDDDAAEAVILALRDDAPNPMGSRWAQRLAKELRERVGDSIPENAVFFQDNRWVWNPSEVAREIRERVGDAD